jgi:Protein of unknown function (DUF2752)
MHAQPAVEHGLASLARGWRACLIRAAAISVAAISASKVLAVHDLGVVCPLRRLTGIPCPLCGSTTAFAELGSADISAGAAANPVTLAGVLAVITAPLGGAALWWRLADRTRTSIIAGLLTVAWAYQLIRLGVT